jgi:GT2 family glycosyltransferase
MANHNIAILIPVHNGLNFTKKCLDNLNNIIQSLGDKSEIFKVIVIDDGSTDGTKDWIIENYPATIILKGDGHLWWSGGINKGIDHAINGLKCDYTLWWNNDIHCSTDYFTNLLGIVDEISSEIIIGSKIYFADEQQLIWSMGGLFDPHTGEKYTIGMNETDSDDFEQIKEADWLPGMGTLIHKSVFEKIGQVNDKDFPQYHGDSDFTYRAKLAGYHIRVFPQLKIWNDKSNSGIQHYNNFRILLLSLFDIRSNYHLGKDFLFYHRYAESVVAYKTLFLKYSFYIGGFIKWRILGLLGIRKSNENKGK